MKAQRLLSVIAILTIALFLSGTATAAGPFINNGDGTVTDESTDLLWIKKPGRTPHRFLGSDVCEYCDDLKFAGYDDWRAPRIDELRTIINYQGYATSFPFRNNYSSAHSWSSTTRAGRPDIRWEVHYSSGAIGQTPESQSYWQVRCVRGGPFWNLDPSENLVIESENTAKDIRTGLLWNRKSHPKRLNWAQAKSYCESLALDGRDDWKLPTIEELQTIVDYTTVGPATDSGVFDYLRLSNYYWTETPHYKSSSIAWTVSFTVGTTQLFPTRLPYGRARCVSASPASQNEPPMADAGPAQTVELASSHGTEVTLGGSESTDIDSSSETNDDIVDFDWYKDDILLGSGESFVYTFPLGAHTVKLIVTDSAGESAEDEVVITIEDTTPPEVAISASPGTLWPPNGKMKDVLIQGDATDISGEVSLALLVEDEYGEINLSLSDFDEIIQLEAWRKGRDEDGRTYTINVIATDSSGNSAFALTFVIVPHDMGGGKSKK